ncbi:MAG: hypothetical protein HZA58_04780 [Acidimicrobiia bacterium]|nr:hypothetical protein [Acidimicrobiia bacterium]
MANEHLAEAVLNLRQEIQTQLAALEAVEARIAKAHREHSDLVEKINSLGATIEAIEAIQHGDEDKLTTTRDYILAALQTAEHSLRDEAILQAIEEMGWLSAAGDRIGVVRTFLSRMVKREEIERVAPATYDLPGRTVKRPRLAVRWDPEPG